MRVELLTPRVEAKPGSSCQVELEVYNTGEVIDSVTSRVVGHPFDSQQAPSTLSLFPESGDRLTVSFLVPDDFAAGSHTVPIEVASTFQHDDVAVAELELEVAPVVTATLGLTPSDMTAGKKAKFAVDITNTGNVPLDLTLTGNDVERVLRFRFEPLFVHAEPGETVHASGIAVGKRPFFGASASRTMTVLAWGNNIDLQAAGRFVQKPRIARGFLTFVALAAVILIWAAVIVAGAGLVLKQEATKKTAPESFVTGGIQKNDTSLAGSATGMVTSGSGLPVERITVEAWRTVDGESKLMGSAATDGDGVWELAGLLPARYRLKFSAPGFRPVWYPGAASEAGAQEVRVRPAEPTEDIAVTMTGLPGTITGFIAAGESSEVKATITVKTVVDDAATDVVTAVTTEELTGAFTVEGLATPAVYELAVEVTGFDRQSIRVELGGGETEVINTVNMAAAPGSLSGSVIGPDGPLGGVAVTLTGNGQEIAVTTPTDGPIGTWIFTGLPSPATYLITFALDGYGTQTIATDLGAGANSEGIIVQLAQGTGQVSGIVTGPDGPLGGVTVAVTGAAEPITTTTLTTGDVGRYVLNGLAAPGHYTLTFSLDGYSPVTVGVDLDLDVNGGTASDVDAMLLRSTSSIVGTIRGPGGPLPGALIELSDGKEVRATISADDPAGGYRFDSIPAGRYTLTITLAGFRTHTVLVTVDRGETEIRDATLEAA